GGVHPARAPTARLAAAAAWLHAQAGADQARAGRITTATLPTALGARVARLWWPDDAEPEAVQ
ncbi:NAD(P)H-hydrate dehydratase, partial [Micrococcus luteus]|nr:NAD(P)H-hydrate dehydratase [Micrococcus luteus]